MRKNIELLSGHLFTIYGKVNFKSRAIPRKRITQIAFLAEDSVTKIKYVIGLETKSLDTKQNYSSALMGKVYFKEINKFPKKYIKPLTKTITCIFLVNNNHCCMISEETLNCEIKDYIFILSKDNGNEFYPEGFYIINSLYWREVEFDNEQNKITNFLNCVWEDLNK